MSRDKTAPGAGGDTGFALCGGRKTGRDKSYSKMRASHSSCGLLRHWPAGVVAAVTLTMALLLLAAVTVPARAANASALKSTIENWGHGGAGSLSAEVSDNIVTVTGGVTDAQSTLSLNINSGVTVVWEAALSSATDKAISVYGAGTLEIADGGSVSSDTGKAIYAEGNVTVSGGSVSSDTDYAICTSGNVTVSGGEVTTGTETYSAIYASGGVTVSGGSVSNTEGTAIIAYGSASVSGGSVSTTEGAAIYAEGDVTISGGSVSSGSGNAISVRIEGASVEVSGGSVSTDTGYAIYTYGENPAVTVSGGSVRTNTGRAIYTLTMGQNGMVTVSGSGIVQAAADGGWGIETRGCVEIKDEATVSATTGYAISASGSVTVSGGSVSTTSGKAIYTFGLVTVSGGSVTTASGKAIHADGLSATVEVSGGEVSSTTGNAIQTPNSVTVSAGTVSSKNGGYAISASTVTVSGGTVSAENGGRAVYSSSSVGSVTVNGGSVISNGDNAIYSLGSVTVSDGTVSATKGRAIYTEGASSVVTVSGGTVSAVNATNTVTAVYLRGASSSLTISGGSVTAEGELASAVWAEGTTSTVTVSGGSVSATSYYAVYANGAVSVSSGSVSSVTGSTIRIQSTSSTVEVSGGSVTTASGIAISSHGSVMVSGGSVGANTGYAIYNSIESATVAISGGVVYALKNQTIDTISSEGVVCTSDPNVTGNGMIIACSPGSHTLRSAAGISVSPSEAAAYWDRKDERIGISYANGENTGFIPLEGVTVEKLTLAAEDLNYTIPGGRIYTGAAQGIGAVTIGEAHSAYFDAATGGTITVKYAGSAAAPKDAGTYAVTAEISGGTEYAAVSIPLGEYTIAKREITLTADDKTVAFGSALPELTYTVGNLAAGETVSDAISAEPVLSCPTFNGSEVGTYPVTISGGTATGNYSITSWINGMLTVSEQVFTVIFDLNGGTRTGGGELTQTIAAGGAATAPTTTRSGYTFSGWDNTFDNITSDITIKALWRLSSGGSGGSSSGTTDYVASVSGDGTGSVSVTVDTSAGAASVKLPDTLGRQISDGKSLVVTLPSIPGVTVYGLGIPAQNLSSAGGGGSVQLNTEVGSVTIPSNMLNETGADSGGTAQISIGTVAPSSLPDSARAAVGGRPVVSLSLSIDGKPTDWNNPDAPVTVSIPYTPTEGEDENAIVVYYIDGSGNLTCVTDGRYDPETASVTFGTTHFSDYAVGYNPVSFADVTNDAWYNDAVTYLAARGITHGTGDTTFSPNMTLTRGQFIVLLLRAYNIQADENPADNFSDAGDTYYTGYLAAAKRLGISEGVGDNRFAPEQAITRQEMFTLLYNTLTAIDALPKGDSGKTLSDFTDSARIASYAAEALTCLVETGVVSGSNGALLPQATASRAEMAQVLYNLLKG